MSPEDKEFFYSLLPELDKLERKGLFMNRRGFPEGLTMALGIRMISDSIIKKVELEEFGETIFAKTKEIEALGLAKWEYNNLECPVCYFMADTLIQPYDICSRCGTEFGYDDDLKSHEQLRREWINNGCKTFINLLDPLEMLGSGRPKVLEDTNWSSIWQSRKDWIAYAESLFERLMR